jgi:hypothetical protein
MEDFERYKKSIIHISTQDAYEHIRNELSTIADRFYKVFDARKLRKSPTKDDWKNFAIPSKLNFSSDDETYNIFHYLDILNRLHVIYQMQNYSVTSNDEVVNDENSGISQIFFPKKNQFYILYISRI